MSHTHIISYSGGLSSAITAYHVLHNKKPDENIILLFADTTMEDPDLYRFNDDFSKKIGIDITVIKDGRDVWQVFEDVGYQGNTRRDPCSKHLKRDLIRKWILDNYHHDDVTVWIGYDCLEEHRLPAVVENNKPLTYRSWLIENNIILLPEYKKQFCDNLDIKQPRLYDLGMAHNNCGGFCVKAGLGQFKILYETLPDVYMHHENKQEKLHAKNPKLNHPFLRKQINGKTTYLSLKEYREKYLETGNVSESEAMEFGACGCGV